MNSKKMRFSIRNKILIGSLSVNLLICLIMGVVIYHVVYTHFVDAVAQDTLSLAKVSAARIDGDTLDSLNEGDDESTANLEIQKEMIDIQSTADMNSIYTIGERNNQMVYITLPEEYDATVGEAVEDSFDEEARLAYESDGYATDSIEWDEEKENYYVTAYAPIYNQAGEKVAIIGIDYIVNGIVSTLNQIVIVIIVVGLIIMVLSAVISIFMANGIARGLKVVNNKVYDLVSADGDLTQQIHVNSNDEVSDIADNINNLLDYIRKVIQNIHSCSNHLSGSVDTALTTTIHTTDEINTVSSTMEEMSAAMEETSASLQQVQDATVHIKQDVDAMFESVQSGTDYASEMESRAKKLCQQAEIDTRDAKQTADEMTISLNEKIESSKAVENISNLTQQILEIAAQTNLLSLNASIEAARAGEHGKGFAVVADEISALATNSADTAKEIQVISNEVIDNVHALAAEATNMVEFVRTKTIGGYQELMNTGMQYQEDAEKVTSMLTDVENASKNIEDSMNGMTNAMSDVSIAVEESARGITQVASDISDMSDNMNRNKEVADENSQIVEKLEGEVNHFKF